MGACAPATVTVSFATVYPSGPTPKLLEEIAPFRLGARPAARIVAMLQGEIEPFWKSAPFTKLLAVICGPGGDTVREKVTGARLPALAVTVTAPAVPPACTVTCARPLPSVVTLEEESVAGPLTEKFTV